MCQVWRKLLPSSWRSSLPRRTLLKFLISRRSIRLILWRNVLDSSSKSLSFPSWGEMEFCMNNRILLLCTWSFWMMVEWFKIPRLEISLQTNQGRKIKNPLIAPIVKCGVTTSNITIIAPVHTSYVIASISASELKLQTNLNLQGVPKKMLPCCWNW